MTTPTPRGAAPVEESTAGSSSNAPASAAYRQYVLGVLVLVYAFNFVDRQILAVLLQPIKEDLGVSDTAMGVLTGLAFALFYTFAGIPIARLADGGTRRSVIAAGVALWSAMTAVSGFAQSYLHLVLARIGVGVGEAAASPPAHSLLSDYFAPSQRGTALAIYNMGANAGILMGFLFGGWVGETFGWRNAFLIVGLPGLAVAALVRFTVREPPRGVSEGRTADPGGMPPLSAVLRTLAGQRSFVHVVLAASLFSFSGYGFTTWGPTFLIRVHGLTVGEAGFWLGVIVGIFGALGTFTGGWLSDRLGERDVRNRIRVPALGGVLAAPLLVVFLVWPDPTVALVAYGVSIVPALFYVGPCYSLTQSLAPLRMRAQASALILFSINLLGLGVGPVAVGAANDLLLPIFGDEAIRFSLLSCAATSVWGAVHALLATRTLAADLAAVETRGVVGSSFTPA